jgi:Cysteine rich repeat
MRKIVLMVCAAFMLLAPSAMAQETLEVGPCTADEWRLCSGVQPGRESLGACFRAHIHELSDACLLSLARLSALDQTCREPLKRACASVEPGEGRLESCLRSAVVNLSDDCKDALRQAIPGAQQK